MTDLGPQLDLVAASYRELFGHDPEGIVAAPGRVNLIGEHTDYNGGLVFPAAIDRYVWIAFSASDEDDWRSDRSDEEWKRYPLAMRQALRDRGIAAPPIRARVSASLPSGKGLSSSAALLVGFGWLWNAVAGYPLSRLAIAQAAQAAEVEYVGVRVGIMDPLASAMGRRGSALFVDVRSLEVVPVALGEDLQIVVADTGVERRLVDGQYNRRRQECEEAARRLGVASLRDVPFDQLDNTIETLPEALARRVRHVVKENERVLRFREALNKGDDQAVQAVMAEAHAGMRDDFEASSAEQDAMTVACRAAKAVGARITGGGFGGACVALVRRSEVASFIPAAGAAYLSMIPSGRPSFLECEPTDGVVMSSNGRYSSGG